MSTPPGQPGPQAGLPACVRHPDRPTGLACTRCRRPACPECLRDASVGFHCVDCVAEAKKTVRRPKTVAGADTDAKPIVVPVLIALNVVMFLVTAGLAGDPWYNRDSEFYYALVDNPMAVADGQWWRLITHGFLHDGPLHLLVNMAALWLLRDLETTLGWLRYLAVYFLAMIGGSLAEYLFADITQSSVGASGGVYGVTGAFVVLIARTRRRDTNLNGIVLMVVVMMVATSFLIPRVSLLAHVGGLLVGAAVAAGMMYAPSEKRTQWQAGAVALIVLVLFGLFALRTGQLADLVFCVDATRLACVAPSGA